MTASRQRPTAGMTSSGLVRAHEVPARPVSARPDADHAPPRDVTPGSVGAAWLRQVGWRAVLTLSGGYIRHGRLPHGGCVVVADHVSHADTPAVLAALDPVHTPRVAAAADYWFSSAGRASFCRIAVAGFPVRRGGGGSSDLAAAGAVLECGGAVVVYPAGSRVAGAETCHRGAFRLAAVHGVPVVPVGVNGTGALLPKSGRLHRTPITVRIGTPVDVDPDDLDPARCAVTTALAELRKAPSDRTRRQSPRLDSKLRVRMAALAAGPRSAALLFVAAFAEALSWPLLPELTLAVLLCAAPAGAGRVAVRLVGTAMAGSVLGGLATALLARHGILLPQPMTTPAMGAAVRRLYAERGATGVWEQPLSGVPFKVFARAAGQAPIDLGTWIVQAGLARATRMIAVAIAASALARWVVTRRPWLYSALLLGGLTVFVPFLVLVLLHWR